MSGLRPAVFLDRDGTLNIDAGYLDRKERLMLFPWSLDSVRLLRRAGYAVVVVTNQSGVGRGMIEESFVEEVHQIIQSRLVDIGEKLDGHYYCPHEPSASIEAFRVDCDCRKPKPGLVTRAARDLGLDVERSIVVGDKWSDIGLAKQTGARGVLVRTGYGRSQEKNRQEGLSADAVVDTLMDAVNWILLHPVNASQ
jgi:D-glycero-D-manno-heptose 1,7-bisphosphate phosphatase